MEHNSEKNTWWIKDGRIEICHADLRREAGLDKISHQIHLFSSASLRYINSLGLEKLNIAKEESYTPQCL